MARETSKSVASRAAKILSSPASTPSQRSAAASALTQYRTELEATSAQAASRASEILRDPNSTAEEKSVAASTLSQRADR